MKKLLVIIIVCFFCNFLVAQTDTLQAYITKFDERLVASVSTEMSNDSFYIFYNNPDDILPSTMNLMSNSPIRLVGNVSYKVITVSLAFTPNLLKTNKELESTKDFSFTTRFSLKKWHQSVTLIKQKGFLVNLKGMNIFAYPGLQSLKIGGTTSYVFNDKFSYKTIFNHNEWQKKSTGSFIANFAFYYTNLKSSEVDSPINLNVYSATISPAYYYNLVINNRFLLGAGASIGAGIVNMDGEIQGISEFSANAKLDYNYQNFFSFLSYSGTSFYLNHTNERYTNSFEFMKLEIGYRFNPPKKVKSLYHKIL